jgi:anti-sigma-K factor RskA
MTLDQIKEELAAMPEDQQSHQVAFLVHLRHSRDPKFQADATRQIDDKSGHWISPDQLREHWKE